MKNKQAINQLVQYPIDLSREKRANRTVKFLLR